MISYRTLTEHDWGDWVVSNARGFLEDVGVATEMGEQVRSEIEADRSLGAFDGDELVGKTHAISLSMSVPGGDLPTAGVTAVTVSPTHRRRGILTELTRRQLDDIRERGEPLAALTASESLIYGRFGYGLAAQSDRVSIDRRHTDFVPVVPAAPGGEIRFVAPEAARERWPPLYERLRGARPGMIARTPAWWGAFVIPRSEKPGDGFTRRQYVEYSGHSGLEGYASYAARADSAEGIARGSLRLHELVATNPAAEAALWRYVFGVDLVETIEAHNRPSDDPLLWMLADPRRLRRLRLDNLWLRILDVPGALEGRTYLADGRLVLDVRDPFGPWAAGRVEIDVEDGNARCRPSDAPGDLTLGAGELAAVYLGGVSATVLARAGRIEGSPEALRLADALFAWHTAPWCADQF